VCRLNVPEETTVGREWVFLLGRVLFATLFLASGFNHLANTSSLTQYAAAKKVPAPRAAVLLTGVILLVGGLSVLLGFRPEVGLGLIGLFLLVVTPKMHNFWTLEDPMMRATDMAHFLKNLALLGATLMLLAANTVLPHPWPYALGR
jgi:putative oxidoreductase